MLKDLIFGFPYLPFNVAFPFNCVDSVCLASIYKFTSDILVAVTKWRFVMNFQVLWFSWHLLEGWRIHMVDF